MARSRPLVMFVWLVCLLAVDPGFGRDIYVATVGNDAWPGTATQPYRLIKTAISRASSGDTIRVRAGIYSESSVQLKTGLTLVSEDGRHAAKLASWLGSGSGKGFVCVGVSNVEIRGFESYSSYGAGTAGDGLLRIFNSDNIRIKDCLLHDAPLDCDVVKIGGNGKSTTNTLIENCVIYNPAPTLAGSIAECIDAHPVDGLTVRNCWIYHTEARKGDILCRANNGSRNVVWENNVFGPVFNNGANRPSTSAGTVDADTPVVPSVDTMTVRNNLFVACQGEGAFSVVSSMNVRFYNNLIWDYRGPGAAVALRNTAAAANQGLDFRNNIVCNTNGKPAFAAFGAYTPGTFTHDYNLYWQVASGGLADIALEPHSLLADPLLSARIPSPAGGWAAMVGQSRPLDASPAVDAGADLSTTVPTDICGRARPIGSFDIGPHEIRRVGDIDGNGYVDAADLAALAQSWATRVGQSGYLAACDLNDDAVINVLDLLLLSGNWGG